MPIISGRSTSKQLCADSVRSACVYFLCERNKKKIKKTTTTYPTNCSQMRRRKNSVKDMVEIDIIKLIRQQLNRLHLFALLLLLFTIIERFRGLARSNSSVESAHTWRVHDDRTPYSPLPIDSTFAECRANTRSSRSAIIIFVSVTWNENVGFCAKNYSFLTGFSRIESQRRERERETDIYKNMPL